MRGTMSIKRTFLILSALRGSVTQPYRIGPERDFQDCGDEGFFNRQFKV